MKSWTGFVIPCSRFTFVKFRSAIYGMEAATATQLYSSIKVSISRFCVWSKSTRLIHSHFIHFSSTFRYSTTHCSAAFEPLFLDFLLFGGFFYFCMFFFQILVCLPLCQSLSMSTRSMEWKLNFFSENTIENRLHIQTDLASNYESKSETLYLIKGFRIDCQRLSRV